ncbi:DDB1- and CUL4-associated factor 17-like [Ruditapes philippinarum]|uniref:DDB1- and CUL4-associated factor 17-like n=1 Tax=Ruditapes philippinarum TaxID=129788 RepID=UPI00295C3111|nr:DDB1- and CUL4-associated factor 17-like [Ruditapes philippinarum]
MSFCIIYRLRNREISNRQCTRKDFHMLRTLICKGNREYRKVCTRKSNKAFCYESGRLFSNNYRECYYGYGIDGGNCLMYKISDQNNCSKLEDALIYKFYHEEFPTIGKACLMALKTRPVGVSLVQYDLNTGELIKEIFLSCRIKFRYLDWAEVNKMFYIKSIRTVETRLHLPERISSNVAVVMAVFSTFPLKFVGMFEVDRRIFGAGVTNAILTHGMLIIMYVNGLVKFFSFDRILEKFKNFEHSLDAFTSTGNIDWAELPADLPINIKITEIPPLLFEVSCCDQDVKIGGFPWHYIYSPKRAANIFQIKSLKNSIQVEGGALKCVDIHAEPDSCSFHNDDSGRIIHVSGGCLNVFKLHSEKMCGSVELQTVATVNVHKPQQKVRVYMTSSGRRVKRRQSDNEVSFHDDDDVSTIYTPGYLYIKLFHVIDFASNSIYIMPNVTCLFMLY